MRTSAAFDRPSRPILFAALSSCLMLAGCDKPAPDAKATAPVAQAPKKPAAAAKKRRDPVVFTLASTPPSAAIALDKRIEKLGDGFRGDVGLAVRDVQTGWTSHYRGLDYFPQQSVSKLWVALGVLDQVDQGRMALTRDLAVRRADLTLFHQPIRALVLRPGGFHTSAEDLLERALTQSDNSANDRLLTEIGGPDAVRATMARKGIGGIRFGPGERRLQAGIAGLDWKPGYAVGNSFYAAREALSDGARRTAFDAYVADPVDGATPMGMVDALARLKQGQLLSPASTDWLTGTMSRTKTGPQRLKGGLTQGWTLSHKTGTGQVYQGEQAGYNDVGILTSPTGRAYAVAVLIGRTARPLQERMALMQKVVAATIDYDANLEVQREAVAN